MMEMAVILELLRCAKLQSNRHQEQSNSKFFHRQPFLSPNQQCQSIE